MPRPPRPRRTSRVPGHRRKRRVLLRPPSRSSSRQAISKQDYYERRRPGARRRCSRSAKCSSAPKRADRPAVHARARSHHRARRPVDHHGRRVGNCEPDRCPDHDRPARPGLCRHPGGGRRPARTAARAIASRVVPTSAIVRLKLPDGSDYDLTGKVQFSESVVNQNTGRSLCARFPEPPILLLPGMFVNAQFAQAVDMSAFLVPRGGHARSAGECDPFRAAGPGNRAVQRAVVTSQTIGPLSGCYRRGLLLVRGDHPRHGEGLRDGAQIRSVPAVRPEGPGAAARRNEGNAEAARPLIHVGPSNGRSSAWVLAIIIMLAELVRSSRFRSPDSDVA